MNFNFIETKILPNEDFGTPPFGGFFLGIFI